MSYPIFICEDDLTQLQQLKTIIDNYVLFHNEEFYVKMTSQSPDEIIKYVKKFNIQHGIYFLDIDLNHQLSGIDLAKEIRKLDVQAKIIFITTHDEMAPVTFKEKIEAMDFIIKDQPTEQIREKIYSSLEESQLRIDANNDIQKNNFCFSIGSQTYNIEISDVILVETSMVPHRLDLYTKNGKYEFYGKLIDLELMYPKLFRINRSCLINPLNVRKINFLKKWICFDQGIERFFSLGKAKKLKKIMEDL